MKEKVSSYSINQYANIEVSRNSFQVVKKSKYALGIQYHIKVFNFLHSSCFKRF